MSVQTTIGLRSTASERLTNSTRRSAVDLSKSVSSCGNVGHSIDGGSSSFGIIKQESFNNNDDNNNDNISN